MKSARSISFDTLEVVRLARAEWRVSDSTDPGRLLGYIERQQPGRYEIVWMTDPVRWGYAASFEDALVAFGDSARFTGVIVGDRAALAAPERVSRSRARRATWIKPNGRSSVA